MKGKSIYSLAQGSSSNNQRTLQLLTGLQSGANKSIFIPANHVQLQCENIQGVKPTNHNP